MRRHQRPRGMVKAESGRARAPLAAPLVHVLVELNYGGRHHERAGSVTVAFPPQIWPLHATELRSIPDPHLQRRVLGGRLALLLGRLQHKSLWYVPGGKRSLHRASTSCSPARERGCLSLPLCCGNGPPPPPPNLPTSGHHRVHRRVTVRPPSSPLAATPVPFGPPRSPTHFLEDE